MKDDYSKKIQLRCSTCGSDCNFQTDEATGIIVCKKCNRKYYGGYDELVDLNQKRVNDELQIIVDDVKGDLEKELKKIFKNL